MDIAAVVIHDLDVFHVAARDRSVESGDRSDDGVGLDAARSASCSVGLVAGIDPDERNCALVRGVTVDGEGVVVV